MSDMEGKLQLAWAMCGRLYRCEFAVLAVHIDAGQRRPTIEIMHSPNCSELGGIPTCEIDDDGVPQQWTIAVMGGCRVRWRPPFVSSSSLLPVYG